MNRPRDARLAEDLSRMATSNEARARVDVEVRRARAAEVEREAKLLGWEARWQSFITGDFRAMEERAERAEAKLREAEERAEKASRECSRLLKMLAVCSAVHGHNVKLRTNLDEARTHCRSLVGAILDLAPYPPEVAEGVLALVANARAALGEKP